MKLAWVITSWAAITVAAACGSTEEKTLSASSDAGDARDATRTDAEPERGDGATGDASSDTGATPNDASSDARSDGTPGSDAGDGSAPVPIAITNPSFEMPAIGMNSFDVSGPPLGWQVYGTAIDNGNRSVGVLNPNGSLLYLDTVPHGQNVAVTFLLDNFPMPTEAGLQQTLTAVLETNTTYTLRVFVGNLNPVGGPWDFTGFPGYRVELVAGGMVIASDNDTLRPGEGRFLLSTVTAVIGASHARAGQALGIRLVNRDASAGIEVNFDDVRLTAQR